MKLNTITTNLILLSIILFSSFSFIISEPTRHKVIFEGGFSSLKYKKIKLKLHDEVMFCLYLDYDASRKMFDHDKILMPFYEKGNSCDLYKAVKTGKFEVIFEKRRYHKHFFSLVPFIKDVADDIFFMNYKKWDVVVSE